VHDLYRIVMYSFIFKEHNFGDRDSIFNVIFRKVYFAAGVFVHINLKSSGGDQRDVMGTLE